MIKWPIHDFELGIDVFSIRDWNLQSLILKKNTSPYSKSPLLVLYYFFAGNYLHARKFGINSGKSAVVVWKNLP